MTDGRLRTAVGCAGSRLPDADSRSSDHMTCGTTSSERADVAQRLFRLEESELINFAPAPQRVWCWCVELERAGPTRTGAGTVPETSRDPVRRASINYADLGRCRADLGPYRGADACATADLSAGASQDVQRCAAASAIAAHHLPQAIPPWSGTIGRSRQFYSLHDPVHGECATTFKASSVRARSLYSAPCSHLR